MAEFLDCPRFPQLSRRVLFAILRLEQDEQLADIRSQYLIDCDTYSCQCRNDMTWELILFVSGTLAIAAGCLLPKAWMPPMPNDKLMHFLAYGVMALLASRIAHSDRELAALLIGLFVAGWVIEALQDRVPGRSFCWRDLAANTAGILLATIVTQLVAI